MIDPNLENHHQQTAYLAYMIGGAAGFDEYELGLTSFASLVHIKKKKRGQLAALLQADPFIYEPY